MTNTPDNEAQNIVDYDQIVQFYFEHCDVRGALVRLGNSFIESINGHDYPNLVHHLLGECLAASTLMSTSLKNPTRLTMQARGEGALNLLMAEAVLHLPAARREQNDSNSLHQTVRAFARYDESITQLDNGDSVTSLAALLGSAQLAITLEPMEGQRYQGIVGLELARLENCIENYFEQSEQLSTCLRLATNEEFAAGLLLQRMPNASRNETDEQAENWNELATLAASIQNHELTSLPFTQIMHRLFHQHPCRLGQPQPIAFQCTCSAQRTGEALLQVDAREIQSILDEDGEIVMDCEFCSARYRFDQAAIDQLSISQQGTRH